MPGMYFWGWDPTYILVLIGAIISMITVIFLLPSMLMAFDRIICKTTRGMKGLNNEKA